MDTAGLQDHFVKAIVYQDQLKTFMEEQLMARQYVDWQEDVQADVVQTPSIGQAAPPRDHIEDTPISFTDLDTGAYQFVIDKHKQQGLYITNEAKENSAYAAMLESMFVPKISRAMEEQLEADIFGLQSKQTAGDPNNINGVPHRRLGSGSNNGVTTLDTDDFAFAKYAFKKANVPLTNIVAIVDPSVALQIETDANLKDFTYNPQWEGLINTGMTGTGMRFIRNIHGFDVYESNFLAEITSETISGTALDVTSTDAVVGVGKANLFLSMDPMSRPFIGAWRRQMKVESTYNMQMGRTEYTVSSRYGLDLKYPESLVTILSGVRSVAI